MEQQYSRQFFTIFVESLQSSCKNFLNFNRFVEVSGYISVEIDNTKKERYVLSELLQSSGSVISESFCTKVLTVSDSEQNPHTQSSPKTSSNQCVSQRHRRKPSRTFPSHGASVCSSGPVFPGIYGSSSPENMMLPVSPAPETVTVLDEAAWSYPGMEQFNSGSVLGQRPASQSVFNIGQFKLKRPSSSSGSREPCSKAANEDNILTHEIGTGPRPKKIKPSVSDESIPIQFPSSEFCSQPVGQNANLKPFPDIQVTFPRTVSDKDYEARDEAVQPKGLLDGLESGQDPLSGPGADTNPEVIDLDMYDNDIDLPCPSSLEKNNSIDLKTVLVDPDFDLLSFRSPPNTNPGSYSVMKSVVKRFKRYHIDNSGGDVNMVTTPPVELNTLLLEFYEGAKKADGTELTGGSLKNIQVYLERYVKESGYPYSIAKDDEFKTSRDFVRAKQDSCKLKGVARYLPLDDNDIELMFLKNVLGGHSPESLFNTIWFMNSKYFVRRKPGEHFNLKWGEIVLSVSEDGQEYLERPIMETFSLKLYANPDAPNRCFVRLYKQYRDMRPKLTMEDNFPFYLKMNKSSSEDSWFLDEPMPWSPFTYMWKKLVLSTGLPLNTKII